MSAFAESTKDGSEDMIRRLDLFLEIIEHHLTSDFIQQDFVKAALRGFVMLF